MRCRNDFVHRPAPSSEPGFGCDRGFFTQRLEVLLVCKSCGSAYPSSAGQGNGCRGSILSDPVPSWALSQRQLLCSAPYHSGRNIPHARLLVVTDNWNPRWLGNENHCGGRGVWACSGCAIRHHRSVCCRLDPWSRGPHHNNILVQLCLVYDLGSGCIATACAFLCKTPNCAAEVRIPVRPVSVLTKNELMDQLNQFSNW